MPGFPASGSRTDQIGDQLAVGESNMDRYSLGNGGATSSGNMVLSCWTASRSEICNNIYSMTTATAAAATPTLCRMGVYQINADGSATLLAACANDTTLWNAATTKFTRALTTPFAKAAGQLYGIGILCVSAVALPTMVGNLGPGVGTPVNTELTVAPRITGIVTGLSDLPATVAAGGFTLTTVAFYGGVTP